MSLKGLSDSFVMRVRMRVLAIPVIIIILFFAEFLGALGLYGEDVKLLVWTGLLASSGFALLLYGGIELAGRRYGFVLPACYPLFFAVAVLYVDAAGNIGGWYDMYSWFDEVMHVLGGAAVAAVGLAIAWGSEYWRGDAVIRGVMRLTVLGVVAVTGIMFEGIEFMIDEIFGQKFWLGDAVDTLTDLLLNLAGAVVAITLLRSPQELKKP